MAEIVKVEENKMISKLQKDLSFSKKQIENVIGLHEEGCTIPFIARYRKERTSGLDEVQIRDILERYEYLQNLENRKQEVIRTIDERGKLTPELAASIMKAEKLQEVEDLYRPYKEKRRTKATIAKEKGLEPLAHWMLSFEGAPDLFEYAAEFINEEKEVANVEDAISGAKDIIAEVVSEDAWVRDQLRQRLWANGFLVAASKDESKDEKGIYAMYYEYQEPLKRIVAHRTLAMNRGEKEDILKVGVNVDDEMMQSVITRKYMKPGPSEIKVHVGEAMAEAYKKYIYPSLEREVRKELTENAEEQAIHIFGENVKQLLMQPPLKEKVVLAIDPAYRTGCKLAVIDGTGKVLQIDVIYPHTPKNQWDESKQKLITMVKKHGVNILAVGNGTASRESEKLAAEVVKEVQGGLSYIIVNEAGASVYSASDLAREEFPDLQVEQRSAVSIGRRIQDPLAELVKIDPKSVGVGQYQHDVSQKRLGESLEFVVETAVNQVGVNVNTASVALLQYVSGLSKVVAKNVITLREENGKFTSRDQLKKVPRLGAKTYEQAIGFLRVLDGVNPLDRTAIHPEHYKEAGKLLKMLGFESSDIGKEELTDALKGLHVKELSEELGVGEYTLQDILDALSRPNRDPREALSAPLLRQDVLQMEDIKVGMQFEGVVRNIVDFGAFVDIGVKQDGLVHKSKIAKRFVKHPMDVLSVGQIVTVWVDEIDMQRHRVALTMVEPNA